MDQEARQNRISLKRILTIAGIIAALSVNACFLIGSSNAQAAELATMRADIDSNTERNKTLKEDILNALQEIKLSIKENSQDIKKILRGDK